MTSGQIIANQDTHTELTYTVPVSAIIQVVMDSAPFRLTGATTDFEIPASADSSVAERITDRTTCPADRVCATFAAVQVGTTMIGSMGPAGNGIMPAYFAFQLVVV